MSEFMIRDVAPFRPGKAQQVLAKEACPVCHGNVIIDRSPIAPDSDEQERYLEDECSWWAWEGDRGSCFACNARLVVRVDEHNAWLEAVEEPGEEQAST